MKNKMQMEDFTNLEKIQEQRNPRSLKQRIVEKRRSWSFRWKFSQERNQECKVIKEWDGLGFIKPTNPSCHVSTPFQLPIQSPRLTKPYQLTQVNYPV